MCENRDRDKDRPDLELERLVMGDEADGVRPSEGWFVREDVVRGVLNLVKGFARAERVDLDTFDAEQTSVMLEERTFRALAEIAYRYAEVRGMLNFAEWKVVLDGLIGKGGMEPYLLTLQRKNGKTPMDLLKEARRERDEAQMHEAAVKIDGDIAAELYEKAKAERDELREQVEALTAQLEEEEQMVKRLREDVLGAPRGTVKVEEVQRYVGSRRIVASVPEDWPEETKVALVRLSPDGLELAGADPAPQSIQDDDEFKCPACGSSRKTTLFITCGCKSPEGCAECGLAIADDTEGADA